MTRQPEDHHQDDYYRDDYCRNGYYQDDRYQDEESRWKAVLNRDASADGFFYYAVRTTSVYCRPACPSRRPKRENVSFFDTTDAAELAGFRPCLRCRPNEITIQQQAVARIQRILDGAGSIPSLADLGKIVGYSPFHLQRVFKRLTGLSPRQYAMNRRAERLKTGLKNGAGVTQAMLDAGYGSNRALYEDAGARLGMSPSAYRKGGRGERVMCALFDTPLGRMLIAATARGICALWWGDDDALLRELLEELPHAVIVPDREALSHHAGIILEYLSGDRTSLSVPLDVEATDFQRRVWDAIRQIPYGETCTYSEVARIIGEPGAVRAVARACASNPVALAVPCHRVVGADGGLHGYRWGLNRKRALLERERASLAIPCPAKEASVEETIVRLDSEPVRFLP